MASDIKGGNSSPTKVAVIGTGAAGLGVLSGLLASGKEFEITVIDPAKSILRLNSNTTKISDHKDHYQHLYTNLFRKFHRQFPPPKTHHGDTIPRFDGGQGEVRLFKSESIGGLTNYWGGTMLPFTDREFKDWPIERNAMDQHYNEIAKITGISGVSDPLLSYFGTDFSNRPPIQTLPIMHDLVNTVNKDPTDSEHRCFAGLNRICLETREQEKNSCVYCGECMAGCFRESVFSSKPFVDKLRLSSRCKFIEGRVKHIRFASRTLSLETKHGIQELGDFSRIYLCAGCPASTEILMRSAEITTGPIIKDNAVYVFPILYMKAKVSPVPEEYLSQCNLIIGCESAKSHFAQAQIYPNFDYLWRYNIPPYLQSRFGSILKRSRGRIVWARLYVHSDWSQSYAASIENDSLKLRVNATAKYSKEVKQLYRSLRKAISKEGFYVPPMRPILQKTNSHYGSSFPYGGNLLNVADTGEFAAGCYLCDSTVFPAMPAVSPTFTIMANARRIAENSCS